jgi:ribonucleoside-diphosphate reductase alpha chain
MAAIQNAAYRASAALAAEKGSFPLYDAQEFLGRPNVARLDDDVRAAIAANGIRNGCLTSIAPTGTISLLAGNVSSGIEPVFDFSYRRRVRGDGETAVEETVEDYAYREFRAKFGDGASPPEAFVTAEMLSPAEHIAMQAALQPYVDSAISKTINCPEDISFEQFRDIYAEAYELGLKGCTTYRPNPVTGAVLSRVTPASGEATTVPQRAAAVRIVEDPAKSGDVVYMTKPLERDAALEGMTYKIKWPASAHALYVTINDIVRDGRRRPFEIFINTKNLEHYAWTVALTRMISAVFRRGGDVTFVAEELKAVFDPEGGRWMGGRYVPSLLAAIGDVIEQHMIHIGFLIREDDARGEVDSKRQPVAAIQRIGGEAGADDDAGQSAQVVATARVCPKCGERALRHIEGCWTCTNCDYSRCG